MDERQSGVRSAPFLRAGISSGRVLRRVPGASAGPEVREAGDLFSGCVLFRLSGGDHVLFALAVTDGQLRFYVFLGEGAGFAAYYFTIGRMVMRFAGAAIRTVLRIWKLFWNTVRFPLSLLWKLLRPLFSQAWHFLQKILEKPAVFFKKA